MRVACSLLVVVGSLLGGACSEVTYGTTSVWGRSVAFFAPEGQLRTVVFTDVETLAESYITLPAGQRILIPEEMPAAEVGAGGFPLVVYDWNSITLLDPTTLDRTSYDLADGCVFLLKTHDDPASVMQLPIPVRKLRGRSVTEEIRHMAAYPEVVAFMEGTDG